MNDLVYGFSIDNANPDRKRYTWHLKGDKGGVHIWVQFTPEAIFSEKSYGGCEVHHPAPPYDCSPKEAPIKDCWLIGGDCWCEGSSLYFSETIQPLVEEYEDEPDRIADFMNTELLSWYRRNFDRDEEE